MPLTHTRSLFCVAVLLLTVLPGCTSGDEDPAFMSAWPASVDRVWVGPEYWANRLQDWRVENGRLVCVRADERHPMRAVHVLTRRMGPEPGTLRMSVRTGAPAGSDAAEDAAAGFLIGAGRGLDYRGAALVFRNHGPGAGYFAGLDASGTLFIRDLDAGPDNIAEVATDAPFESALRLVVDAEPTDEGYRIRLTVSGEAATPEASDVYGTLSLDGLDPERMEGSLALVAHHGERWFDTWAIDGTKVERYDSRTAGPVLSTQYTLSRQVMKMTAQLMPVDAARLRPVRLEVEHDGAWTAVAEAEVDTPSYTATFRVAEWDDTRDAPYRVVYDLDTVDGTLRPHAWHGTVRRDPVDQRVISVAGFTGNHNVGHGFGNAPFDFTTHVWFPHTDIVEAVDYHGADVLFFSGDQVYEGGSPTYPDRSGAPTSYLDYLYKWYLWCWAYRDITRDRPTITIPDDHDVYQGNLWGQGGRPAEVDNQGGYVMPARWVRMSERTQTSHLPDPYDPTPIDQGIGVYYTSMVYGRIGFAILEDRKFKTGAAGVIPDHDGRPDHITDPDFDPARVDLPGLELLGDRQLAFLDDWAADWRGQDMKVAVSQTIFAALATHHGADLFRLYADLDANGWPQSGRNRALDALRRGFAFMLGGDQHLSTLAQHGIDDFGDAGYSFAVPSVANFYPRGWLPEAEGLNRPEGAPPYLGDHFDGFGNRITMYAVTNPTSLTGISTGREPLDLHDKMPGYGVLRLDKADRTITVENWPRYADPSDPETGGQYEGWPRTIRMEDNYGRAAVAFLPTLNVEGMEDPVVQVVNEATGETEYTLRINGSSYRPKVFALGTYTVHIGNQETGDMQTLTGLPALSEDMQDVRTVTFEPNGG